MRYSLRTRLKGMGAGSHLATSLLSEVRVRWWRLTRSCWAEEHEPHEHAGSPHLAHSVADLGTRPPRPMRWQSNFSPRVWNWSRGFHPAVSAKSKGTPYCQLSSYGPLGWASSRVRFPVHKHCRCPKTSKVSLLTRVPLKVMSKHEETLGAHLICLKS